MQIIETIIYTSSLGVEAVTGGLLDLGIEETVVEDPRDIEEILEKKNSYDWDFVDPSVIELKDEEAKVKVYLEDNHENRELLQKIKFKMMELKSKEMEGCWDWKMDLGRLYVEVNELDSAKWENSWKEYFKPRKITPTFVVKPNWEDYDPLDGEKIISIDPQTAFGTGGHETTRLCMTLLEQFNPRGKVVLDIGAGSGILSIGASMLGATNVIGIDIDPSAVAVANDNILINGVENNVHVTTADFHDGIQHNVDIIVSNLMADLVRELGELIIKNGSKNLLWISGGILVTQREATMDAIKSMGFSISEIKEEGEWCAIAATL
jgi:ribosomal protein L11 methyltransferase